VSAAEALAQSLNVPAVRLLGDVGVQNLLDFFHEVGITSLTKTAEYYGLALTLGDGEVSLLELTSAFDIFANGGQHCSFSFTQAAKTDCRNVIDAKYSDMVTEILTNSYAKLLHFPQYSALDFGGKKIFVKTGTSRNFKDNWAVGFDDRYLIGVWA